MTHWSAEVAGSVGGPDENGGARPNWRLTGVGSRSRDMEVMLSGERLARPLVIGRKGGGADIGLDLASVSRRHIELRLREGTLEARDLRSTNGTMINGEVVRQDAWHHVKAPAEVILGADRFWLERI